MTAYSNAPFIHKLYSTRQVRAIEQYAINQIGITGIELMERAGHAAFHAVVEKFGQFGKLQANGFCVFCGPGNNGGDGYVFARVASEHGIPVRVYKPHASSAIKGDALIAFNRLQETDVGIFDLNDAQVLPEDIVVDALLGTGLDRNVKGEILNCIDRINIASKHGVVALDIPSGLNADTGAAMGACIKADISPTFVVHKQGMFTGNSYDYCGEITLHTLNIPHSVVQRQSSGIRTYNLSCLNKPLGPRSAGSHKGSNGHVLVIGGNHGMSGAVRLCAEAALRTGAGLVTVATRGTNVFSVTANRSEIMCHGVENIDQLDPLLARASIIVIGPGLGQDDWAVSMLTHVIGCQQPLLMDADALNLVAKLHELESMSHLRGEATTLITPHPAEAARLLQISTEEVQADRYAAIKHLSYNMHAVTLLKGAGSLVQSCDEDLLWACSESVPALASAGMGDLLCGIIAALIAQGMDALTALKSAVAIHCQAGLLCSQQGVRGTIASDLFAPIRQLVNEI